MQRIEGLRYRLPASVGPVFESAQYRALHPNREMLAGKPRRIPSIPSWLVAYIAQSFCSWPYLVDGNARAEACFGPDLGDTRRRQPLGAEVRGPQCCWIGQTSLTIPQSRFNLSRGISLHLVPCLRTSSARMGKRRMRLPVTAKIAFATAGAIGGTA